MEQCPWHCEMAGQRRMRDGACRRYAATPRRQPCGVPTARNPLTLGTLPAIPAADLRQQLHGWLPLHVPTGQPFFFKFYNHSSFRHTYGTAVWLSIIFVRRLAVGSPPTARRQSTVYSVGCPPTERRQSAVCGSSERRLPIGLSAVCRHCVRRLPTTRRRTKEK